MLRPYQQTAVSAASDALFKRGLRSVLIQSPTGSGKTPIIASICESVTRKNFTAWVIVPRTELLKQASAHLHNWKVPHGIIAPGFKEMSVYKIHVVSKDTLIRRYDKIKKHPDLIIIDEAHIAIDRQLEISRRFSNSKIIGFSATPEKTNGQGLSTKSGGVYDELIQGASIPWLTERGYLSELRYFSPPIRGLENLHKKGTEYDSNEVDQLLEKNKIYGEAIDHYRKHADKKPALVFCRSVEAAYHTAEQFRRAGYDFQCIEGSMSNKERTTLIQALRDGKIHGLTNCEIATYGLDIPRVEVGICLRPTMSRALYFQMVGRILRPWPGKKEAIFFDHVNNLYEHIEPDYPQVPPFYAPTITWNFDGTEKRKKKKDLQEIIDKMSLTICPVCFQHSTTPGKCSRCNSEFQAKPRKEVETIQADLREIKPAKFNDLPPEEKREHIDSVNQAVREYKSGVESGLGILPGPVGKLIEICKKRKYNPMWVYRQLVLEDALTVNVTLLHEIARQMGYKPSWVHFAKKQLKL